jgi:hypothetical protein
MRYLSGSYLQYATKLFPRHFSSSLVLGAGSCLNYSDMVLRTNPVQIGRAQTIRNESVDL